MGKNYTAEPLAEADWDEAAEAPRSMALPMALAGQRLDHALVKMFPQYSRNRLQAWLKSGHLRIDGAVATGSRQVSGGERVDLAPLPVHDLANPVAQKMPLAIVFEDAHLIVLDKPAGLVVHPGAGNPDGTLLNALLAHAPALRRVPRAGIVHRLDKDTSGLLVVAKNLSAQAKLAAQLAERSVKRTYLALVFGSPPERGTVDAAIGRDPRSRTRMAVVRNGREARTGYRVLERFAKTALLECRLETGRTHQIRVHLQHIKHPIVGDPVYRRGAREGANTGAGFPRQALHAAELELIHPRSGKPMSWSAPLPDDMARLLDDLRRER